MKLLRIIPFLFLTALLSACISQNEDCPTDRNIVLKLDLALDLDGYNGKLGDYMHYADLFIFDATTGVLKHRTSTPVAGAYTLVSLNHLRPGSTYRIVAWGNATPERKAFGGVNPGSHIDDAYIGRAGVPRSAVTSDRIPFIPGNGDPLFFAPGLAEQAFTIAIPAFGDHTETLYFARAYIGIEVFVIGFDEYTGEAEAPVIEIDEASSHFDFDRVPFGDITLRETTVIQTQYVERPAVAKFRTKLFDDNANLAKELHVRSALGTNEIHFTIDDAMFRQLIAQFMTDNNITSLKNDAARQRIIPITIHFGGANVAVSVGVKNFEEVCTSPTW